MEEKRKGSAKKNLEAEREIVRLAVINLAENCKNIEALLFVANYLTEVNSSI